MILTSIILYFLLFVGDLFADQSIDLSGDIHISNNIYNYNYIHKDVKNGYMSFNLNVDAWIHVNNNNILRGVATLNKSDDFFTNKELFTYSELYISLQKKNQQLYIGTVKSNFNKFIYSNIDIFNKFTNKPGFSQFNTNFDIDYIYNGITYINNFNNFNISLSYSVWPNKFKYKKGSKFKYQFSSSVNYLSSRYNFAMGFLVINREPSFNGENKSHLSTTIISSSAGFNYKNLSMAFAMAYYINYINYGSAYFGNTLTIKYKLSLLNLYTSYQLLGRLYGVDHNSSILQKGNLLIGVDFKPIDSLALYIESKINIQNYNKSLREDIAQQKGTFIGIKYSF